jgi:hypothetical protein
MPDLPPLQCQNRRLCFAKSVARSYAGSAVVPGARRRRRTRTRLVGPRLGQCRTHPAKGGFVRIPLPERRAALWTDTARAYGRQGRLPDGYQALRIAENCAAQDVRRPDVLELVADMAARDRRRTLPELHHFARRLGVPA